jgi:ribonuclease P protein component
MPELALPGVDYVLVARQTTPDAGWAALLDDVGNALIRLRAALETGPRPQPRGRAAARRAVSTESD